MVPAVAGNVSQSPKCYQGTFPPLPVTFHVVPGYALRESERERESVCVVCPHFRIGPVGSQQSLPVVPGTAPAMPSETVLGPRVLRTMV